MKIFGRKKESKANETTYEYEIFGGFTVTKGPAGYEIRWKGPNVTTINVQSMPVIDKEVQIRQEGDKIQVLTSECKLKVVVRNGESEAYISKL